MISPPGIVTKPSRFPVSETLDRLETLLREKGVKIFARIDHSGEARNAGLTMPDTQVLIFGNPKAGTPAMLETPLAAIDLPLKTLAWQDAHGSVWLSYYEADYLRTRFGFSEQAAKGLAAAAALIEKTLE
jgi:uncharacterized protein (DUF302 family)